MTLPQEVKDHDLAQPTTEQKCIPKANQERIDATLMMLEENEREGLEYALWDKNLLGC
jgi:hypothetical protein